MALVCELDDTNRRAFELVVRVLERLLARDITGTRASRGRIEHLAFGKRRIMATFPALGPISRDYHSTKPSPVTPPGPPAPHYGTFRGARPTDGRRCPFWQRQQAITEPSNADLPREAGGEGPH